VEGRFIAYYRVSTASQGRSGLGLEAQQAAVRVFLNGGRWSLLDIKDRVDPAHRLNGQRRLC
jgi:DNA invertase Pin-like site-specific DNA recombinase